MRTYFRSIKMVVRTYEEECKFIERVDKCSWKIKKGFVPNMNVSLFCLNYLKVND